MSLREGIFLNFLRHRQEMMRENDDRAFSCDLPSLGHSNLHQACQLKSSNVLHALLKVHVGTVDIVDLDSGATPLVTACSTGNLESVALLVRRGANVNHGCSGVTADDMWYENITPIYVAAEAGHAAIVEYLGKHGADVNVEMYPLGLTPVHRAIILKRKDVVSVLIEKLKAKVSIPSVDTLSSYPIYNAIAVDDSDILEMILKAEDADPNVPSPSESITALHLAAYKGDLVMAEILISHGANVNAQLKCGHSPLDLAVQEKALHVVEYLKAVGGRRKVLDRSWHPFIFCVINGLQSMKVAVNRGADINALLTPKGGAALHFFVAKRKMDACKFLIRKGADIERKCALGKTPIHIATERGLTNFIEFLLEKGANINARSNEGFTPLHKAALMGDYPTCKLLISKGADLEAMSRELGPPIIGAIHQRHTNIVKLLLKAGASPNAKNPDTAIDKINALQIAVQFASSKPEIIRALIEAGADVKAPIYAHGTISYLHVLPMVTDKVEPMKLLIEAGAYLDAPAIQEIPASHKTLCMHTNGSRGDHCMPISYCGTPLQSLKDKGSPPLVQLLENTDSLFKAVRKNDLALAKKYHEQGGLINCCSVRYDTPLIYASWKGFAEMVKFLLSNGAKIDMSNNQNSSPLHYAARYNQKEVTIELLKAGALINLIRANKTPLELAQEHNNYDTVAILEFAKKYLIERRSNKISPVADWKTDPKIIQLASEFKEKISEEDLEALFGF